MEASISGGHAKHKFPAPRQDAELAIVAQHLRMPSRKRKPARGSARSSLPPIEIRSSACECRKHLAAPCHKLLVGRSSDRSTKGARRSRDETPPRTQWSAHPSSGPRRARRSRRAIPRPPRYRVRNRATRTGARASRYARARGSRPQFAGAPEIGAQSRPTRGRGSRWRERTQCAGSAPRPLPCRDFDSIGLRESEYRFLCQNESPSMSLSRSAASADFFFCSSACRSRSAASCCSWASSWRA